MTKISISTIYSTTLPFFKMVALYFIVAFNLKDNSIFYSFAKVAPIVSLIGILQMQKGIKTAYIHLISLGLFFSAIGDIFLVFRTKGYFSHGTFSFSLAHFAYLLAFGFFPIKIFYSIPFFIIAATSYYLTYHLFVGIQAFILPIYMVLVCSMGWRALSQLHNSAGHFVYQHMRYGAAVGGACFVISDIILCTDIYDVFPFPHKGLLVMLTYYAAQFGITISAIKEFK